VIWFGNLPQEMEPLWRQMYGHYGPYFWTMMAGCFFIPFVAFIFAVVKRSIVAMCVIAAGINLGNWLSKYLMVVPVFDEYDRPFSSFADIFVTLLLVGGFAAAVVMLMRKFPIYSGWEMRLKPIRRR
jgi:hypothetical protein